jgi:cation diffusion facilitator family transporter
MAKNTKYIRIAAVTALIGNGILATLKVWAGNVAGSQALIGDGMDSFTDVGVCIITLFVVRLISRPADEGHPWGHGRAETVATAFLSFIIFFVGAQLIVNSATDILSGAQRGIPSSPAMVVALISVAGKILLALSQRHLGKLSGSLMIKANAKNMASDAIISIGVIAGILISSAMGSGIADKIIAILIGTWIIRTAIGIFMEANHELMDGGAAGEEYRAVFDAVKSVKGADNPHRTRIRRIAGFWDIDIDIEVASDITVQEAHGIALHVEEAIKERLENVYDIVVHIEPRGDDSTEVFGLSENE